MVDRVGEWIAFSQTHFCRQLTLYDTMLWPFEDQGYSQPLAGSYVSLSTFDIYALAPNGGGLAVSLADPDSSSSNNVNNNHNSDHSVFVMEGGRHLFQRDNSFELGPRTETSERFTAQREQFIDIFTSAGERRGTCCVPAAITCALEGFSASGGDELKSVGSVIGLSWTKENELCALLDNFWCLFFNVWSGKAATASEAVDDMPAPVSFVDPSRCVCLVAESDSADAAPTAFRQVSAHRETQELVLVCDMDGFVYAALHEDRSRTNVLSPICLQPPPASTAPSAQHNEDANAFHVTALEGVPPDWDDESVLRLFWGMRLLQRTGEKEAAPHMAFEARQTAPTYSYFLCTDSWEALESHSNQTKRLPVAANVVSLRLSHSLADIAVYTSDNVLFVLSSNLERIRFSLDLAISKVPEKMSGSPLALSAQESTFFFHSSGAKIDEDDEETTDTVRLPEKMEWCGQHVVMLHFSATVSDDAAYSSKREAPMFSLLVCVAEGADQRVERLDWGMEGDGHVVSVAEVDGVRLLTMNACYLVQQVPSCLVDLCRVRPPFSKAAELVRAYAMLVRGDRQGVARVRALLADDQGETTTTTAEDAVEDLLDAAQHELPAKRQHLLLSAASFACENANFKGHSFSATISYIVDRLRVLSSLRESAHCHMPLTMPQYELLAGHEASLGGEHHSMRHATATEAQVLIDRLSSMREYQLALDVAYTFNMRTSRTLASWACKEVEAAAANSSVTDEDLFRKIYSVLSRNSEASYVEAAIIAYKQDRKQLALLLLNEETQLRTKVLLFLQMGELLPAARAVSTFGDSELLHMVLSVLSREQRGDTRPTGSAPPVANVVAVSLYASPQLLVWLQHEGVLLSPCFRLARQLLVNGPPAPPCWYHVAQVGHVMLRHGLQGQCEEARQELRHLLLMRSRPPDGDGKKALSNEALEAKAAAERAQRKKSKRRKGNPKIKAMTSALDAAGAAEGREGEEEREGEGENDEEDMLPLFHFGKPSSRLALNYLSVYAALSDAENMLRQASALCDAAPRVQSPVVALAEATERTSGTGQRADFLTDTLLSPPGTSVKWDLQWLERHRELDAMQQDLAMELSDSSFTAVTSVVEVIECLSEQDPLDKRIDGIQKRFNMKPDMVLCARVRGAVRGRQLDALAQLLGPPVPLEKSFFHRSKISSRVYEQVVVELLRANIRDRAVDYVAGISTEAVKRVEWYMKLGAPIMAVEAAFEDKDASLIEQVMRRMPQYERLQETGAQLIRALSGGG